MKDIFQRDISTLNGVFRSEDVRLTFPREATGFGVLVQSMSLNYAQVISRLYEVGGPNFYYVAGRTSGNAALQRVLGPRNTVQGFYEKFGNACNAKNNNLNINMANADCSVGGEAGQLNMDLTALACVITQGTFGVAANDMVLGESAAMQVGSVLFNS